MANSLGQTTTLIGEADLGPLEAAIGARGKDLIDIAAVDADGAEINPPSGFHTGGPSYLQQRLWRFTDAANASGTGKALCLVKTSPKGPADISISGWQDPAKIGQ